MHELTASLKQELSAINNCYSTDLSVVTEFSEILEQELSGILEHELSRILEQELSRLLEQ